MRRSDREILDRDKMLAIAAECDCCRLGLSDKGRAYIVPMNFGFTDENGVLTLYFHCASEGRKLELIGGGAYAGFEMDCGHALVEADSACAFSYSYKCVMGEGKIEQVTDVSEKLLALNLIMKHYSGRDSWSFEPRIVDKLTILRLTVTAWSCKVR